MTTSNQSGLSAAQRSDTATERQKYALQQMQRKLGLPITQTPKSWTKGQAWDDIAALKTAETKGEIRSLPGFQSVPAAQQDLMLHGIERLLENELRPVRSSLDQQLKVVREMRRNSIIFAVLSFVGGYAAQYALKYFGFDKLFH